MLASSASQRTLEWLNMSEHDSPSRITVSRDALRADLAEMELRLRAYFDEQLRGKASAADVAVLTSQMADQRRGEFTEAQSRSMVALIESTLASETDKGWTTRHRVFAIIAVIIAVLSFSLTVYVNISSASNNTNGLVVWQ